MTTPRPVKERQRLVGVIASPADLEFALRMKQPPDLFELRLDCLCPIGKDLEKKFSRLFPKGRTRRGERAPFIMTARDPREGGMGNLSLQERRALLLRFLSHAKYVDVELRSARALKPLLAQARKRNVRLILSFHDFQSTPTSRSLRAKAQRAKALGADIFKVATRTDKPSELARLVDFITNNDARIDISAMGVGRLGVISRLLLARSGSALNYAALQRTVVEGQLPIDLLRSALGR